jgi:hypothetical protein
VADRSDDVTLTERIAYTAPSIQPAEIFDVSKTSVEERGRYV